MTEQIATPQRFRAELRAVLVAHATVLNDARPIPHQPQQTASQFSHRLRLRLIPTIVLVVLAVIAVLLLRSGGALRPQPATAAAVLNATASSLDHHGGSLALGPGDYFYSRTLEWWRYGVGQRRPYVVRSVEELWLARDGVGRSRDEVTGLSPGVSHSALFAHSQDVRLRRSARPFIVSAVPDISFSYAQLLRLPTEPARLAATLERLTARNHVPERFPQRDVQAAIRFAMVRDLAETPASAALRAALYRVLARTPGVRLLGLQRDSIGRQGAAVVLDAVGQRFELIMDPATGALLQTSRTLVHWSPVWGKQPLGLIARATFVASGVVRSLHARVR